MGVIATGNYRSAAVFALSQVSAQTGIPESTLRRWCFNGEVDCFKAGKMWMVWESDIPSLLKKYQGNRVVSQDVLQFVADVTRARDIIKRGDSNFLCPPRVESTSCPEQRSVIHREVIGNPRRDI